MTYVYLMYANLLDEEGDKLKSLEMYDQALECVDASDTQMMQNIVYNKAVALSKMKDDDRPSPVKAIGIGAFSPTNRDLYAHQ